MFDRKSQYDRSRFDRTFTTVPPVAPVARVPGLFSIATRPGTINYVTRTGNFVIQS